MRKLWPLVLVILMASCGADQSGTPTSGTPQKQDAPVYSAEMILSQMESAKYKEGEVIVKFKTGTTASSAQVHATLRTATIKSMHRVPNLELVRLPDGLTVKDAVVKFMSDPAVEYAEPNYIVKKTATPNDPDFQLQWSLRNVGQTGGTPGADIKAVDAWDVTVGHSSVLIAVIDSGIDYNHPDLAANVWFNQGESACNDGIDNDGNGYVDDCRGWDFTTCSRFNENTGACVILKNPSKNTMDDDGHGTHVSGTIAAVANNGLGISGVMWYAKLLPVKALNYQGFGYLFDIAEGVYYAVDRGARAVNMSLGGYSASQTMYDAINYANQHGVIVVAAAGNENRNNDGPTPFYPASYKLPNIISVGATDKNDHRWVSNIYPDVGSNYGTSSVLVAAPGVSIYSTVPNGIYGVRYATFTGTSMATPHVTGLVGLLYSYYYDFNYLQIKNMVLNYSDVLPSLAGLIQKGRINAYRSLSALWSPVNLSATVASSSRIDLAWTDRSTAEEGFKVERKTTSTAYAPIGAASVGSASKAAGQVGTTAANATSYADTTVIDGTTYYYRVRPYNAIGESAASYSNEASATTPLNAPTNLTVTPLAGGTQVQLAWTDNSQAEEGFVIEIRGGTFQERAKVGPNVTSYIDSGLTPQTWYTYRVRAFNTEAGPSGYSNEVEVRTTEGTGQQTASGGGGGCALAATPQEAPDIILVLLPLLAVIVLRIGGRSRR